jgi:hypothetical protein
LSTHRRVEAGHFLRACLNLGRTHPKKLSFTVTVLSTKVGKKRVASYPILIKAASAKVKEVEAHVHRQGSASQPANLSPPNARLVNEVIGG